MIWLDFGMFVVLLGLFFYVFASSSITVLHRVYLILHMIFIMWPLCQFISQTISSHTYKMFYLLTAYAGLSLLGVGWFVFIVFLTGESSRLRKGRLFLIALPAMISVSLVVTNPQGRFLQINDQLESAKQLQHGSLYWVMIIQLLLYLAVSVALMAVKLRSSESEWQRTLIRTAFNGITMLLLFSLADLYINLFHVEYVPRYIPLVSIGMTAAALYLVHAIGRNRVFDIIKSVQRDVINTMALGVIVLDENHRIIEINRIMKKMLRLRLGDKFDGASIASKLDGMASREVAAFLEEERKRPLERLEFEMELAFDPYRHVIVQSAPILNPKKQAVGRVMTFQDVTELRLLVEETNRQNEQLQDRYRDLLLMQDELFQANKKLERMAITDGLTGCYNRRYLLQHLEQEVATNVKYGVPFSIFLFDLDHFKSINDRYGHLAGDEVLCSTVQAVRGALRMTDVLARYGGEEFTVYLPHTNREQADLIAARIMGAVESNRVKTGGEDQTITVTISMGIISIESFEAAMTEDSKAFLREMLAQADAALYEAKFNGRNRIVAGKLA
jgi:two-component system cell cycle response regulator